MHQKSFITILIVVVILVFGGYYIATKKAIAPIASPNQQNKNNNEKQGVPSELNQFISQDLIKQYTYTVQKTGEQLIQADIAYSTRPIDLNGDGQNEFIVEGVKLKGIPEGGTNEDFFIWGKINSLWRKIGMFTGSGYTVLETKTNQYYDIEVRWHLSASEGNKFIYKWGGQNYHAPPSFSVTPDSVSVGSVIIIRGESLDPIPPAPKNIGNGWLEHSHVFVYLENTNGKGILWEGGSQGGNAVIENKITVKIPSQICKISEVGAGGCPGNNYFTVTPGKYSLSIEVQGRGPSNVVSITIQ